MSVVYLKVIISSDLVSPRGAMKRGPRSLRAHTRSLPQALRAESNIELLPLG